MANLPKTFPNITVNFLYNISIITFYSGLPNFWIEDLNISKVFVKTYTVLMKLCNYLVSIFILAECVAFTTQQNLSTKQASDQLIFSISHPILWSYNIIMWRRDGVVRKLFSHIIKLKSMYNNEKVEEQMLKRSKRDLGGLVLITLVTMVAHTISALLLVFTKDGTFTTIITAYPLVEDNSASANVIRIIFYWLWWVFAFRTVAAIIIVMSLTIIMRFEYKSLQRYFLSLADIFEESNLTQANKEKKYTDGFKFGIELHLETIEGINQLQKVCSEIFSGQIIFLSLILVFLMTQMMKSERTIANTSTIVTTAVLVLTSTGFFFWNAGDVTYEASKVATAMYFSGWHHCHRNTTSVRKIVVIAMTHAQNPVILYALFGFMTLSHESFLSMVKFSYSVFSVIY